jgi:hypothetical protein
VLALNEGLWVKEIHLRRSTAHEEEDDALGLRHHAGDSSRERINCRAGDVMQSESTEAAGGALKKLAAGEDLVHGMVEYWSDGLGSWRERRLAADGCETKMDA